MAKKNSSNSITIVLCFLFVFIVIYLIVVDCPQSSSTDEYKHLPYSNSCEFKPQCLWDSARTIQLSNGMEGNCTLHGIACPSFSLDHDRKRNMGLSYITSSDNYVDRTNKYNEGYNSSSDYIISELENNPDYTGLDSSMELGMYPVS